MKIYELLEGYGLQGNMTSGHNLANASASPNIPTNTPTSGPTNTPASVPTNIPLNPLLQLANGPSGPSGPTTLGAYVSTPAETAQTKNALNTLGPTITAAGGVGFAAQPVAAQLSNNQDPKQPITPTAAQKLHPLLPAWNAALATPGTTSQVKYAIQQGTAAKIKGLPAGAYNHSPSPNSGVTSLPIQPK